MKISLSCSWRYFVLGVYADRYKPMVHIYPFPWIRVTLERL